MELGISSFTYGWNITKNATNDLEVMDEIDLVQKTIDFNLHCLQIGDNLSLHQLTDERKIKLRSALKKHKIRFEIGAKGLTEANLAKYIQLAIFFKSPLLRFVIDDENYIPDFSKIISIIKNQLEDLKSNQITLGIENHDRFKSKELAHIIESIGDHAVGICLDSANSIGAYEQLETVVAHLAEYTVNLHLKDISIRRATHKMGFVVEGALAGQGSINIPWLIDMIRKKGNCKTAILEQWVPLKDGLSMTRAVEIQWAYEGIHYLKKIF